MATSNYPTVTGGTGLTQAGGGTTSAPRGDFIPQLWSDEIIATYKANLVVANLVSRMNHNGKKGDAVTIPAPVRGQAYAKAALTGVTLQNNSESSTTIVINKHYEYSRLIEDIVGVQALPSLRTFYVDDAGYSLARQIDQDIMLLIPTLNAGTVDATTTFTSSVLGVLGGDGATAFDGNANTNTGNASALTDAGIRRMIQTLDDNDVPLSERVLIIPPVEKKNLLGIARFTEQAFVGEMSGDNSVRNGLIGNVYGVPVYVSTNCPFVHVDSGDGEEYVTFSSSNPSGTDAYGNAVTFAGSGSKNRIGGLLHRSALVLIEQMGVRVQTQYKQEYLADLMTADTLYGVGELRDYAGISFVVPAV